MDLARTNSAAIAPVPAPDLEVEILSPHGQVPIFSRVRRGRRESLVLTYATGSIEAWREAAPSGYGFNHYFGGVETHSATQMYDVAPEPSHTDCVLVPGGVCWHDGSSMAFDEAQFYFDLPDAMRGYLQSWAEGLLVFGSDEIEAG